MGKGAALSRWLTGALMLAGLALLLGSCSEDPTEENSLVGALPLEEVIVRDTTIWATSGLSYRQYVPMNGTANLVGASGGYTAYLPLAFFPSFFPVRDTILVERATLELTTVGAAWGGSGTVAFTAHRIQRGWSQSTLTWDSVQSGFYEADIIRGTYSGPAIADTQVVSFDLDTAMVREWFLTPIADDTRKLGIILVPAPEATAIQAFETFETFTDSLLPRLVVTAVNTAGTVRDTSTYRLGADTFVGNIDDLANDPAQLVIQAGVVYRSTLQFDVSFLPQGATINGATMSLDLIPGASLFSQTTHDTVVSPHRRLGLDQESSFEAERPSSFGRRQEGTPATFTFAIPEAVQSWVKGPNYGLLLRATLYTTGAETGSADRYVFHSPAAVDSAARPRLHIVYSLNR
jgi:hypothetical protein